MSERGSNANKEFVVNYKFDDISWSTSVWASTFEEAEMKLRAMASGEVMGIAGGTIPAGGPCPTCGREWDADDLLGS